MLSTAQGTHRGDGGKGVRAREEVRGRGLRSTVVPVVGAEEHCGARS